MQNYSITQSANIASLVGVLVLVLNHFNINIGSDEITTIVGASIAIFGVAANWVHRYQRGDLNFLGLRK